MKRKLRVALARSKPETLDNSILFRFFNIHTFAKQCYGLCYLEATKRCSHKRKPHGVYAGFKAAYIKKKKQQIARVIKRDLVCIDIKQKNLKMRRCEQE